MSNNQDNKTNKLSNAKVTEQSSKAVSKKQETAIEVAKTKSVKDMVLWAFAMIALIASTLVNSYLPGYWQPANDIWVRLAIIIGLIVFAIVCLALTNQGRAFKTLLSDSGVELRRVTWPTKNETLKWTWFSILGTILLGMLIWILDMLFNQVMRIIIGG